MLNGLIGSMPSEFEFEKTNYALLSESFMSDTVLV